MLSFYLVANIQTEGAREEGDRKDSLYSLFFLNTLLDMKGVEVNCLFMANLNRDKK